ncbi:C-terminal binding protein [Alkalicoccobacillus gibsonii]|uniref:C-terminal binding protein n=1 Tax=Alkalicoccobacillus gibsonii TaxID=79881 RepID=UPI0035123048
MISKVVITDCDHEHINYEKNILSENNIDFELKQCKTEEDLIKECQGATVLINQYAPITRNVLQSLSDVKLVVRYGVGVNNVDLEAASDFGVQVCNVPDYGTQEVADHALAFMLAFTRGIYKMVKGVKEGEWNYQHAVPLYRHSEQTVGVIGLGRIGTAFAQKASALGCRVISYDPKYTEEKQNRMPDFVEYKSFEELLNESDVISIHCPLDKALNLIGADELKKMKDNAYLINVSRGGIINEDALEEALTNNYIAGAAVDVLVNEPVQKDRPLLKLDNFLCTPHMGWYSEQAAVELKEKVATEAVRFLKGEPVHYPVNELK